MEERCWRWGDVPVADWPQKIVGRPASAVGHGEVSAWRRTEPRKEVLRAGRETNLQSLLKLAPRFVRPQIREQLVSQHLACQLGFRAAV